MTYYRMGIEVQIPPEAATFFAVFSRFEFALKRGGFLAGQIGHKAEPDWNGFAARLGPDFFAAMKSAPQADIFFSAQPKRLVIIAADSASFQKPADIANLQMLFEAVRLIRNNLFHGEKVYVGERDRALLTSALFVLDSAMAACDATPGCERVPYAFTFAEINGH